MCDSFFFFLKSDSMQVFLKIIEVMFVSFEKCICYAYENILLAWYIFLTNEIIDVHFHLSI